MKICKNFLLLVGLSVIWNFLFYSGLYAAALCSTITLAQALGGVPCEGPASVYQFTMKGARLQRSDGTFYVIKTGTQTFDVADTTKTFDYISDFSLENGTYTAMSPQIDTTQVVAGTVTLATGETCTTQTGTNTDFGGTPNGPATTTAGATPGNISNTMTTVPDGAAGMSISGTTITIIDSEAKTAGTSTNAFPFTVNTGDTYQFSVKFDVTQGVIYRWTGPATCSAGQSALNVTMTIQKL